MPKFNEVNLEVDAVQFTGDNLHEVMACVTAANLHHDRTKRHIVITPSGEVALEPGRWAVLCQNGTAEVYTDEDFKFLFEPVEEDVPPKPVGVVDIDGNPIPADAPEFNPQPGPQADFMSSPTEEKLTLGSESSKTDPIILEGTPDEPLEDAALNEAVNALDEVLDDPAKVIELPDELPELTEEELQAPSLKDVHDGS